MPHAVDESESESEAPVVHGEHPVAKKRTHALWPSAGWPQLLGHVLHALTLVRPVCVLYFPTPQAVFVEGLGQ